jgi:hypothetical protein
VEPLVAELIRGGMDIMVGLLLAVIGLHLRNDRAWKKSVDNRLKGLEDFKLVYDTERRIELRDKLFHERGGV